MFQNVSATCSTDDQISELFSQYHRRYLHIESAMETPEIDEYTIDLHGELGRIVEIISENEQRPGTFASGRSLSMVAGARNCLDLLLTTSVKTA